MIPDGKIKLIRDGNIVNTLIFFNHSVDMTNFTPKVIRKHKQTLTDKIKGNNWKLWQGRKKKQRTCVVFLEMLNENWNIVSWEGRKKARIESYTKLMSLCFKAALLNHF